MSGDAPLPRALRLVTVPLAMLYGWCIDRRNARFDTGANVALLNVPVISIGNITTGGTGKSPMTAWITDRLREMERTPVIAMRGYGKRRGAPSDEEAEYALRLPGVKILAQPNRTAALRAFLSSHPAVDCVLLDDGFQHRFVARGLDLVLIDATRCAMHDALLPAGHLREPMSSLRRADAVIITRAECIDDALSQAIVEHHGRPPIAWTQHAWSGVLIAERGSMPQHHPIEELRSRRIITMLGVGNPQPMRHQLHEAHAKVVGDLPVRDHQHYNTSHLASLRQIAQDNNANAIVTTMKDWVKLAPLVQSAPFDLPFIIPQLTIEFLAGREELLDLVHKCLHADRSEVSAQKGSVEIRPS